MSCLGLNIGTSACNAVIFEENGAMLNSAYLEYPLSLIFPNLILIR